MGNKYILTDPYPEIKVKRPNLYYATLLQDDFTGYVSEMTALTQYMYHHYFFEESFKEAAEALETIAIVEMQHAEMLAHVIHKLGGDPRYYGGTSTCCMPWNGSFVKNAPDPKQKLQLDLQAELEAIRQYEEHISQIDDPCINALLDRFIKDEELHVKIFKDLIKKVR